MEYFGIFPLEIIRITLIVIKKKVPSIDNFSSYFLLGFPDDAYPLLSSYGFNHIQYMAHIKRHVKARLL
jgi:hypothetical protein